MQIDSNIIVLIIVLVAVALALVVSLVALLKAQKALKMSQDERIERIAKRTVENYMLLNYNQKIRNMLHEELVREQQKKDESKPEVVQPEQTVMDAPNENDKPVGVVTADEPESEIAPVVISRSEPVTLYTGICKDGAFKHVTAVPDNKTIFTIYADSKDAIDGILNVDQSAYDKIAQTPDYLQNACVYSGNGTQLKVTKTGTVQKENGTWVVKEPIVAEFN